MGGALWAQPGSSTVDLKVPSEYRIAGLTVLGADFTDVQAVKLFSGLQIGDEVLIPGDRISEAVRNLWDQRLFSDVSIELAERRDKTSISSSAWWKCPPDQVRLYRGQAR